MERHSTRVRRAPCADGRSPRDRRDFPSRAVPVLVELLCSTLLLWSGALSSGPDTAQAIATQCGFHALAEQIRRQALGTAVGRRASDDAERARRMRAVVDRALLGGLAALGWA